MAEQRSNIKFKNNIISLLLAILVGFCVVYMKNSNAVEVNTEKSDSVLFNKPIFELDIKSLACSYQVVLNGLVVFQDYSDTGISARMPVNHWFLPDNNVLEVHAINKEVNGKFDEEAFVKISLFVKQSGIDGPEYKVAELVQSAKGVAIGSPALGTTQPARLNSKRNFYVDNRGDVVVHEVQHEVTKGKYVNHHLTLPMHIPSAIPLWGFFSSDKIGFVDDLSDKDYYELRDELAPIYRKIHSAIINNQVDSIMPLFAERNEEYDRAFYYEPGTYERKLRASLQDAVVDSSLESVSLDNKYLGVYSPYGGQLVKLDRQSGHPAITFNFKDAMGSQSYDIWFRKEGDQWIISR
jgi:hypothetical protein